MRLCRRWNRNLRVVFILTSLTTFLWLTRQVPTDTVNHKLAVTVKDTTSRSLRTPVKSKTRLREGKIRNPHVLVHMLQNTQDNVNASVGFNKTQVEYLKYLKLEKRKQEYRVAYEKRRRLASHMPAHGERYIHDNSSEIEKYYNLSHEIISPLTYKFLLSNSKLCSKKPFMIMLVPSSAENAELRRAIRSTHGQFGRDQPVYSVDTNPVEICTVFIIGLTNNQTVNHNVRHEFKEFNDIVLADFIDSYYNLTLKVLLGLKWIRAYSPDVQYVLKADDDVFVNIPLLVYQIVKYNRGIGTNGSVFGTVFSRDVLVVIEGKWGINKTEYPLRYYPPYAQGTSYTLTGNLVSKIINTAQYLPYLHIEDAFITGIIAHKIHGADLRHIFRNSNWGDPIPSPCKFLLQKRVAQTKMSPTTMLNIWNYLKNPRKCSRPYNHSSIVV